MFMERCLAGENGLFLQTTYRNLVFYIFEVSRIFIFRFIFSEISTEK